VIDRYPRADDAPDVIDIADRLKTNIDARKKRIKRLRESLDLLRSLQKQDRQSLKRIEYKDKQHGG
jgi:hypothetical protein